MTYVCWEVIVVLERLLRFCWLIALRRLYLPCAWVMDADSGFPGT